VVFHHDVEGVRAQGGQDTGRMAEPHRALAGCQEALEQVVHGKVARGTCQHPLPAPHRLANQLDHRRRLARAWRTVQDGHVFGSQGKPNGILLGRIQGTIERHKRGFEPEVRGGFAEQDAAQLRKAIARR
jgi:hypothetical protein